MLRDPAGAAGLTDATDMLFVTCCEVWRCLGRLGGVWDRGSGLETGRRIKARSLGTQVSQLHHWGPLFHELQESPIPVEGTHGVQADVLLPRKRLKI